MQTIMKNNVMYGLLVCCLILFMCQGCRKTEKSPELQRQKGGAEYVMEDSITPQSARSQEVNARKIPALQREFTDASLTLGAPIFLRLFKESRELELWVEQDQKFVLFKTYPIAYFSGTLGPKLREGDEQAPEGFYHVPPSQMNPNSRFHLSFNIGYPNAYDHAHQRTGSAIMVHGNTVSIGCFAMTDPVIEEIYTIADRALNTGQRFIRVHVFPFRMTDEKMAQHVQSPHVAFWKNLQEGYHFFEQQYRPPNVIVSHNRYVFETDGEGG
jgi:murein L,D-transpeptidase YafK